jgi:hypothetical protein
MSAAVQNYNELSATKLACLWMIEHTRPARKSSRK